MSDGPGETASPSEGGPLYDAEGQVIRCGVPQQGSRTDRLAEFVRERPIAAVLLAFGLGYIVGKVL